MMMRANQAQRGQSMVEMVAIGGVATMLFLGIWYVGKFHDIQASTIQAARYAVWERTVHSPAQMSDQQIERQTRARLFTRNQDAYKAADSKANGAAWGAQSANWFDHSGKKRLVEAPESVKLSMGSGGLPGKATAVVAETIDVVSKATGLVSGGEALPKGAMYTSSITVAVNNLPNMPAPLNAMNLKLTEKGALITNSWDASGSAQAANRTQRYTPAGKLNDLNVILKPMKVGLSLLEESFKEFNPGQICPDIVPIDRLQGKSVKPIYDYTGSGKPCY